MSRKIYLPAFAHEKIDKGGKVTDSKTLEKMRELLASLIDWTLFLKL